MNTARTVYVGGVAVGRCIFALDLDRKLSVMDLFLGKLPAPFFAIRVVKFPPLQHPNSPKMAQNRAMVNPSSIPL